MRNILSNLDSSDKSGGERPRDTNLNSLENSAKYNQGRSCSLSALQSEGWDVMGLLTNGRGFSLSAHQSEGWDVMGLLTNGRGCSLPPTNQMAGIHGVVDMELGGGVHFLPPIRRLGFMGC